jgi:hypothetical protein
MDADSLKVECDWVRKLANYGTTIVAAAGEGVTLGGRGRKYVCGRGWGGVGG